MDNEIASLVSGVLDDDTVHPQLMLELELKGCCIQYDSEATRRRDQIEDFPITSHSRAFHSSVIPCNALAQRGGE